MRLEQFQYIVEIARYKSMSKASKKLFITQPSLSTSIQNLEEELGFLIFKRSSQGVTPTPQGEDLLQIAEIIVSQVEKVKEIAGRQEIISGDVNLVAVPVACNALIFELMFTLKKEYPKINLNITELRPQKTLQALVKGPATIGLGTYSPSTKSAVMLEAAKNDLIIEELYEDEMYLFVNSQHPLLSRSEVCLRDLEPFTQAFFKDNTAMTPIELTAERPTLSKSFLSFSDRESIKRAVAKGFAYAILPKQLAYDDIYIESGLITAIPLMDFSVGLSTYLAYSSRTQPNLTEQRTIDLIRDLYEKMKAKNPPLNRPPSQIDQKRPVYY